MNILGDHITRKMPSGILTVDRNGRITGHNPASERIFEGALQIEAMLADLVRESRELRDLLTRCLTTGETFTRVEFNVPVRPDLDKRIGINLSPMTDSAGRIEGAICLLSDLTEIVDLQNRVKLQENFAALGEMSAGIAHEFKNSLATIMGYAQMSRVETDVQVLQTYAGEITKESQALSAMVSDFLNFARPVKATIQDVDLFELLQSVLTDVRNFRPGNYEIRFKSTAANFMIPCDPTLIRQSFLNLLINAAEAIEDTGRTDGKITVLLEDGPRSRLRVVLDDNGRGIAAHQLSKIFLPFFTTKTQGTGLGLSLVQKIIVAHNGQIEVQSDEGRGTRFTITIPKRHSKSGLLSV